MKRIFTVILLLFLFAACALAAASCGAGGEEGVTAGAGPFDPALQDRLEDTLSAVMSENGIPGAIVHVEVPGLGSWETALGLSDVETEEVMDLAKGFRVGSITKTVTATLVLQLVDESLLALDDSLASLVPEPAVTGSDRITLRMLLNHTSGLFEYTADERFQELQAEEPLRKWEPAELVAFAATHELYFPPGEGWQYSNTNFVLQGMIFERITGHPIDEEIEARVAGRLGLSRTVLPSQPEMSGDFSHGYVYATDLGEEQAAEGELADVTAAFDPSWAWAAGGMTSCLDDLGIWARALVEGGLLSEELQKERLDTVEAWQGSYYGLGIAEYAGFWGHPGDLPGFSCAMMYNPDNGALIILMFNKNPNGIDFAAYATFTRLVEILVPAQRATMRLAW